MFVAISGELTAKKSGRTFNPFFAHTYVADEPVLSRSPSHLISAYNTGLSKIMTLFFNDLRTVTP